MSGSPWSIEAQGGVFANLCHSRQGSLLWHCAGPAICYARVAYPSLSFTTLAFGYKSSLLNHGWMYIGLLSIRCYQGVVVWSIDGVFYQWCGCCYAGVRWRGGQSEWNEQKNEENEPCHLL